MYFHLKYLNVGEDDDSATVESVASSNPKTGTGIGMGTIKVDHPLSFRREIILNSLISLMTIGKSFVVVSRS